MGKKQSELESLAQKKDALAAELARARDDVERVEGKLAEATGPRPARERVSRACVPRGWVPTDDETAAPAEACTQARTAPPPKASADTAASGGIDARQA